MAITDAELHEFEWDDWDETKYRPPGSVLVEVDPKLLRGGANFLAESAKKSRGRPKVEVDPKLLRGEAETRPNAGQVSRGSRGPSKQPGSARDVEQRTRIPRETQHKATQHVATAEAHPFMQSPDWSQAAVLQAKKLIEKLDEEEVRPVVALPLSVLAGCGAGRGRPLPREGEPEPGDLTTPETWPTALRQR